MDTSAQADAFAEANAVPFAERLAEKAGYRQRDSVACALRLRERLRNAKGKAVANSASFGFCGCANCSGSPTVEHTKKDFGLRDLDLSSLIPHPSSLIPHPSSLIPDPYLKKIYRSTQNYE